MYIPVAIVLAKLMNYACIFFVGDDIGLMELGIESVRARASATLINTVLGPKTRPVMLSLCFFSVSVVRNGLRGVW